MTSAADTHWVIPSGSVLIEVGAPGRAYPHPMGLWSTAHGGRDVQPLAYRRTPTLSRHAVTVVAAVANEAHDHVTDLAQFNHEQDRRTRSE